MRSSLFLIIALSLMLSTTFATSFSAASEDTFHIAHTTSDIGDLAFDISYIGNGTDERIVIYFFYGSGCSHCAMVEPLIEGLAEKYPQTILKKLEVNYNSANRELFQDFNDRFGVKNPQVPSVFVDDKALIGEDAIKADLESSIQRAISRNDANNTADTNETDDARNTSKDYGMVNANVTKNPWGESGIGFQDIDDSADQTNLIPSTNQTNPLPSTDLTIPMVVVAAAADSINPCAISVMIFLLIFMTSLGSKRRVLQVGGVYVATVYIVYFVAGLGILVFLQSMAITRIVYYAAAVLSIIIGLINIKDFFGNKPTLAIPESRKPMIKKYIEKASIPAAIVLGFAVSLFELPCTGGIYFAILTLLGDKMTMAQGVPYLALYNAIYVLPLAVILGIIYFGVSAEKANSWRLEKRRTLRLAIGMVMLLLGAIMLFGMV